MKEKKKGKDLINRSYFIQETELLYIVVYCMWGWECVCLGGAAYKLEYVSACAVYVGVFLESRT